MLNDLVTIVNAYHLNHQGLDVKGKVFDKIHMDLGNENVFMKRLNDMYVFSSKGEFCKPVMRVLKVFSYHKTIQQ